MIRWSYVLPRALLVLTLCLTLWFGTDRFLHGMFVRTGQTLVGAKVDLEQLQTSLRHGRVQLVGLQVANPSSPQKNLFQAGEARLVLDIPALLRRQFVVREGSIHGLSFSGQRTTSGALPESPDQEKDNRAAEALQQQALAWLERLGNLLNEQVVDQFESVHVAREIGERWPQEYERLAGEADQFKQRIQYLRDAVRQAKQRPLENMDAVQRAIQELTGLRQQMQYFHRRLGELHHQVGVDKENIEYARRRDIGRIEEALRLDALRPEALSEYFLGPSAAPYFQTVVAWTQWAKQCLDAAGDPPRPERTRGTVVSFPRYGNTPDVLLERLHVQGEARLDGAPLPFEGTLTGLSSNPRQYGQPSRLDIALAGPHPARLLVTLDQTGDKIVQHLTLDCPTIKLGPKTLGKDGVFTLSVPATAAHLWIDITLTDDQLDGRILWKQQGLQLAPEVAPRFGGARVANRLASALGGIDHVDAAIQLSGPLTRPDIDLTTSLGREVASGLQTAARQELEERRDALVMRANLEIAQELTRLDEKLVRKKQKVASYLQVGEQLLSELQQFAGQFTPLAPAALNPLLEKSKAAGLPNLPSMRQMETILR